MKNLISLFSAIICVLDMTSAQVPPSVVETIIAAEQTIVSEMREIEEKEIKIDENEIQIDENEIKIDESWAL